MKKHYLIIRLSSMGDVALTVPVLQAVVQQNPDIHLTVITRPAFAPLFQFTPNLTIILPDLKGKHKGLLGMYRLFLSLKKQNKYAAVIDLHDVLRSIMLRFFFNRIDIPVFKIDKGRKAKKKFTQKNHPPIKPLQHTSERYAQVFRAAGLNVDLRQPQPLKLSTNSNIQRFLNIQSSPLIGIAPFAKHLQKELPFEKTKEIIKKLTAEPVRILIFGGGNKENELAKELEELHQTKVKSVIGKFTLTEELMILQSLDLMIAMDSSNMHLARLVGTKVISIWGATHPFLGFSPFQQKDQTLNIQIPVEKLPCRPCSVYGNKPCHRGDLACMNQLKTDLIIKKIQQNIHSAGSL